METHIKGTRYGESFRRYNVWRVILTVKYMETHIESTMYGDSYRRYNVWLLI